MDGSVFSTVSTMTTACRGVSANRTYEVVKESPFARRSRDCTGQCKSFCLVTEMNGSVLQPQPILNLRMRWPESRTQHSIQRSAGVDGRGSHTAARATVADGTVVCQTVVDNHAVWDGS